MDWNQKYRPAKSAEVLGNLEVRMSFLRWLVGWGKERKRLALLFGPPGVGKTLTVELAARETGQHLVELNASDERTRSVIVDKLRAAVTSNTLFGQRNMILLDEVDGIYEKGDTGAVEAILGIVDVARCPVVMTANDPWKENLVYLRQRAELFKFERVHSSSIARRLKEIAEKEGVSCEPDTLEGLANICRGDVRAAIQDLESLSDKAEVLTVESVDALLGTRLREENVFETIRKCWYASTLQEGTTAVRNAEVDHLELLDWAYGNCTSMFSTKAELQEGLRMMAQADLVRGRITSQREWKLLPYYTELLAASIFLPSCDKQRRLDLMRPPKIAERWSRLSKLRAKRNLAVSISKELHERRDVTIKEIIPVLELVSGPQHSELLALLRGSKEGIGAKKGQGAARTRSSKTRGG